MAKQKALLNINRLVEESTKDISPEISLAMDLDYVLRKMNEYKSGYYFKEVFPDDLTYFDKSKSGIDIVCVDKLPEPKEFMLYDKSKLLYHTNDQHYYICCYSDGKPSRTYKPSSMKCIRSMYYQIIGADTDKRSDLSGDFYGICESGTDRHRRIQKAISLMSNYDIDCEYVDIQNFLKENNIDLEVRSKDDYETKLFDKNRNIVFKCDGVLKYKGKYYILEIKTESSYKWMNREHIEDDHRIQAYTYSLELQIPDVIFIYENRDICTKKPYLLHVTKENTDYILDRLNTCNEYVKNKTVPPKEDSVSNKVCQYCEYKTVCKATRKCD